jgi:dolichol-phosphate mannosyltransferase
MANLTRAFSIVIPTYKEHDNIRPLVERLGKSLSGRQYEVLLVDDDSCDGTEELVAELVVKYPVRLMVRKGKKGLDLASHDTVLVMDADLQHPPEVVPSVIQAMDEGADVAVASRYVPGGGNEGWSKLRQVISNGAILLAHVLLPLSRKVKDPMSGFFAFRRELIRGVKLEPIGYKILLELIVVTRTQKVVEVPFMFHIREKGKSKLNVKQEVDYLKHLLSLMRRSGELTRFVKFAIVGGSGVIVDLGITAFLVERAGLGKTLAGAIATEIAIISNFIFNNFFTFADRRGKGAGAFFSTLVKFNLVSLIGFTINNGIYNLLMAATGIHYLGAKLIGIVVAMLWNFFSNNWWTWKR